MRAAGGRGGSGRAGKDPKDSHHTPATRKSKGGAQQQEQQDGVVHEAVHEKGEGDGQYAAAEGGGTPDRGSTPPEPGSTTAGPGSTAVYSSLGSPFLTLPPLITSPGPSPNGGSGLTPPGLFPVCMVCVCFGVFVYGAVCWHPQVWVQGWPCEFSWNCVTDCLCVWWLFAAYLQQACMAPTCTQIPPLILMLLNAFACLGNASI